jgi:hypothetical protein
LISINLQVCGGEEKGRNTCVSTRLAEPGQAWCGVARQGEAMG